MLYSVQVYNDSVELVLSAMAQGTQNLEVLAYGDKDMLRRPCVDCGRYTGRYCDHCLAVDRVPSELWASGQRTPLCSSCDNRHDMCHYCRVLLWCSPPGHRGDGPKTSPR